MPDAEGKLTPDEKTRLNNALINLFRRRQIVCPICGKEGWEVVDRLVQVPEFTGGAVVFGATTYPMVMLVSAECGYAQLLSAVKLGIIEPEVREEVPPE